MAVGAAGAGLAADASCDDAAVFVCDARPPRFVRLDWQILSVAEPAGAPLERLAVATPESQVRDCLRNTRIPAFLMLRGLGPLNIFAALILPGLVDGCPILRRVFRLVVAGDVRERRIPSSGGRTMVWTMTLPRPILAVIALRAFTAADSNFKFLPRIG